jgi:glycerate kinase
MKQVLIAADKFKGSLTTFEACAHIAKGIHTADPTLQLHLFPLADGGDGFQQVIEYYLQTKTIEYETVDPLHRPLHAAYQSDPVTKTAFVEVAIASGLVLLNKEERNPLKTSTLGTGLMIREAIRRGCTSIILGLGGSATNDAGMGILHALGFTFYSEDGKILEPCGENLSGIHDIQIPTTLPSVQFIIASDVQHVLHGKDGAAYVFAKQKGADDDSIRKLDAGLINFSNVIRRLTQKDVACVPGTGAAGGIAAGLMGFFPVEIKSGIEMVIDISGMKQFIESSDIVITGEGKMDEQTMVGKVIAGVLSLAQKTGKPVIICCGENTLDEALLIAKGVIATFTLMERCDSMEDAMRNAGSKLEETARAAVTWYNKLSG